MIIVKFNLYMTVVPVHMESLKVFVQQIPHKAQNLWHTF